MPVEQQIAIIYLGTKGLLQKIPINKVKEFESLYLQNLELHHKEILDVLKKGNLTDEATAGMESVAKELISRF